MTLDLSMALLVRDPPLERLVQQIDFMSSIVSEFIIVDTGSSERDIYMMAARNKHPFGLPKVQVIRRPWKDDFAWARNEALPYVTRSWVLHLDPDEIPSIPMMNHLARIVNESPSRYGTNPRAFPAGILYNSRNYFDGELEGQQEFHWHVRLFRNGRGRWYRALDELVELDGL